MNTPHKRHSLRVMIDEVEREIRMRKDVYPRSKYYRRSEGEELIRIMESVLETLCELDDHQRNDEPLRRAFFSVTLSPAEIQVCEWVGKKRHADAIANHRDPGEGPSKFDTSALNHIRGAKTEFAASVICNLYWRPWVGSISEARKMRDVGGLIEVRSTVLVGGRLVVKPADPDDVPFALIVIGPNPAFFTLAGWLYGIEGKRNYPLQTDYGDPAHYAPQGDLHSPVSLLRWIFDARLEHIRRGQMG